MRTPSLPSMCKVIEGILPLKGGAAIFTFCRAREIISARGP